MTKESIAGYEYEEWQKLEKEFIKDYANSIKYNKSFRTLIREILEGETERSFSNKTELSENMFSRLKNQVDEKDPPQRNTLISVCVGYDLDLMMAQALLYSLGLGFNRFNKRDYAYSFLLTRCRGKSIEDCNEILKNLGVEERYYLGAHARKNKGN
ncbi:MAG: hypothetical protein ACLTOJ_21725 [[Clostridium] symbiosum]